MARIVFWFRGMLAVSRTWLQLLYGMWRIGGLKPPIVSIFGGARLKQTDYYALKAHELAQRLVNADVSVLTGGGPGIMQAANCGAIYAPQAKGRSIGIGVRDLGELPNQCMQEYMILNQFWARKWLLTRYSVAFVVFPGGFGTLDELSEVLTLMQTGRVKPVPIVLVGTEYWRLFMDWCQEALSHGTILQKELDLLFVTDDFEEVFNHTLNICKVHKK